MRPISFPTILETSELEHSMGHKRVTCKTHGLITSPCSSDHCKFTEAICVTMEALYRRSPDACFLFALP